MFYCNKQNRIHTWIEEKFDLIDIELHFCKANIGLSLFKVAKCHRQNIKKWNKLCFGRDIDHMLQLAEKFNNILILGITSTNLIYGCWEIEYFMVLEVVLVVISSITQTCCIGQYIARKLLLLAAVVWWFISSKNGC